MTRDHISLDSCSQDSLPKRGREMEKVPSSMGELRSRHRAHNLVDGVQVATLLTVGEEAPEVYATFNDWETDGDD